MDDRSKINRRRMLFMVIGTPLPGKLSADSIRRRSI